MTVVVAIAKVAPDAGVQLTGRAPSTESVAVAVYVTAAPVGPVASAVMGAGTVMYGSCTVTVNVVYVRFPAESTAWQPTLDEPIGKELPLAGRQVNGTVPSPASVVVVGKLTTVPPAVAVGAEAGTMTVPPFGAITCPAAAVGRAGGVLSMVNDHAFCTAL